MAKHKIKETYNVTGILHTNELKIVADQIGTFDLKAHLERLDGECVTITIKQEDKPREE